MKKLTDTVVVIIHTGWYAIVGVAAVITIIEYAVGKL